MTEPTNAPTSDPAPRHLGMRIFHIAVFIAGGVALWWMLRHLSWSEVRTQLASVAGWFAVILAFELAALCCDAAALHTFMRPEARMIPYWRVLSAQASGRAINVLTPGGALGEPTKLTLLMSHAPRARVLSSIVLLNLAQLYIAILVMLIGIPITLLLIDLPHGVQVAIAISLAILIPLVVALGVVVHRGAATTIVALLRRTRLVSAARAEDWRARLLEVDRHIRELQRNRSAGTWKGILWVIAGRVLGWISSMMITLATGVPLTATLVLGVISIGVLVTWISALVPLGLGVADGGHYVLYDLLGATGPQGLVIAMISRVRSVIVAILGLGAMAALWTGDRVASARKLRALRARAAQL